MQKQTPLTPYDILRRTPKTNCRECGHPTCLAFAAAVATSGFPPSRCPYIDMAGFPEQTTNRKSPSAEKDLELLRHLKSKIAALDFQQHAANLGVDWQENEPDALHFNYLGQKVFMDKSVALINGQQPEDHRDLILLYNYIHSCGGRTPENTWIGLESLPNSISKVRTLAVYCEARLAELFSTTSTDKIDKACIALDGFQEKNASASMGMIIPVFPKVPQYVLYWKPEPEDGFDAKVKLLFDEHIMDFLDLESIVFSAERLSDRFKDLLGGE